MTVVANRVTDFRMWVTARDWLLGKDWTRDGDDPGAWIPPGGSSGDAVPIEDALRKQVLVDGWGWDGPFT